MPVLTFEDALKETAPHTRRLLLGNGFSIAQGGECFHYETLLERSKLPDDDEIRNVFRQLKTYDFEEVMKALEHAAKIEAAYGEHARSNTFNEDADRVRNALITAVHAVHPEVHFEIPEEQKSACVAFLQKFCTVFTLNYDLLLYWVIIYGGRRLGHLDGFAYSEPNNKFRTFSAKANPTVFFVHGALHLFLDNQNEIRKRVKTNSSTIIDGITKAIQEERRLPLFVAEGTADQKLRKINSVPYLQFAYNGLCNFYGSLFIFGHSCEKDEHIYHAIARAARGRSGRKPLPIYFCVHRPQDNLKKTKISLARFVEANKQSIQVKYVDSNTVNVWGPER